MSKLRISSRHRNPGQPPHAASQLFAGPGKEEKIQMEEDSGKWRAKWILKPWFICSAVFSVIWFEIRFERIDVVLNFSSNVFGWISFIHSMNRITYRRDLKKSIKVLVYSFSICEQVFFKQQRQKLPWQLFIFPWHLQPENFCKLSSELSEWSAAPQPQPLLSASELRIFFSVPVQPQAA